MLVPDITLRKQRCWVTVHCRFQVAGQSVGTKHGFMANVVYLQVKCTEIAYMFIATVLIGTILSKLLISLVADESLMALCSVKWF